MPEKSIDDLVKIALDSKSSEKNQEIKEALLDYLKVFDAAPITDITRLDENGIVKVKWNDKIETATNDGKQYIAISYIAKITPCMENGKCAIGLSLKNKIGFGSTEFHVLRAKDFVLPKWIYYFVRQSKFRKEAERNMKGTAGQQRVPRHFIESYPIPIPSLPIQSKIVMEIENSRKKISVIKSHFTAVIKLQNQMNRYLEHLPLSILDLAFSRKFIN